MVPTLWLRVKTVDGSQKAVHVGLTPNSPHADLESAEGGSGEVFFEVPTVDHSGYEPLSAEAEIENKYELLAVFDISSSDLSSVPEYVWSRTRSSELLEPTDGHRFAQGHIDPTPEQLATVEEAPEPTLLELQSIPRTFNW